MTLVAIMCMSVKKRGVCTEVRWPSDCLLPPVPEPVPGSVGSRQQEEDWPSGFLCPGSVVAEDADPSGIPTLHT